MTGLPVIAVIGPTASGKTDAAITLAKNLGGELVCCDSMQVYKYMRIGTAGPTDEELSHATHHLFNFMEPTENYNAALYQKDVRNTIDEIMGRGKVPILCGGTGLYLKAALYNLDFSLASSDTGLRKQFENLYEEKGAEYIHDLLQKKDPESAKVIHKNNIKRVIRALEIVELSGVKKSAQKQTEKKLYKSYILGLRHDRNKLYERIDRRVDLMIEEGLEQEVRHLLDLGVSIQMNAMQAIGYKEWADFFDGEISHEKLVDKIKSNSRHYAKRQLTWFNAMDVIWFDYESTVLHKYTNLLEYLEK